MIKSFLKEEELSDKYKCNNCKKMRDCKRKFVMWKLPDILVIHFKRFKFSSWRSSKISKSVEFPMKLDLSKLTN